MRSTLLVGFGLLVTVQAAAGQSAELLSRIDEQTAAAVAPVLEEALRDSLPAAALESKVLEGVTKGVAASRIAEALTGLAAEFRAVRTALRERLPSTEFSDAEIVAAARAVRQGATEDAIGALWRARPDPVPLEVPVTVLGELVRRGIPVDEASELMTHVVQTEVPLHLAAQIPGKVDGALGTAGTPVDALTQALRVLEIPNPPGRRPGG